MSEEIPPPYDANHLASIDAKLSRINTDMLQFLRPPSTWTIGKGVVLGLFLWWLVTTITTVLIVIAFGALLLRAANNTIEKSLRESEQRELRAPSFRDRAPQQ